MTMTAAAEKFVRANRKSKVVAGSAHSGGGGVYTLASGRRFDLTLEDCRSIPEGFPDWGFGIDAKETSEDR